MNKWYITAFYLFKKLNNLDQIQADIEKAADSLGIRGLLILGPEGINSTSSANSEEALQKYKDFLNNYFETIIPNFKDSTSDMAPFRRFKVKQRDEIVTVGAPDLFPDQSKNFHLTPTEWNKVLKEETDYIAIDTRNWYETNIGNFKGAINPGIDKFTEFPEWLESQNIEKEKKMLIFCTGGIRCEKGILELQRRGYNNVYQLEGGILKYLEEYPNDMFEGECFVFDHRVSVKQDLSPSEKYKLCPHCGQPGETKITCKRCDTETVICDCCLKTEYSKDTCSKHCSHHYKLKPGIKGRPQLRDFVTGITPPSN